MCRFVVGNIDEDDEDELDDDDEEDDDDEVWMKSSKLRFSPNG